MKKIILVCAFALLVGMFSLAMTAEASPILNGSSFFSVSGVFSTDVYWSVYAPHSTVADLGSLPNPAGDTADYTYVYKIDNWSSSIAGITQFVASNPDGLQITLASQQSIVGGISPVLPISYGTFGVFYTFTNPPIGNPGYSNILYYTSPHSPQMVLGGVQSSLGPNDWDSIPGPRVPEPASVALMGLGLLGFVGKMRRKFMA